MQVKELNKMDRKINLDFCFRKNNNETSAFSESLFKDLHKCLSRFKISASKSGNTTAKQENFTIILLSSQDMSDKQFVTDLVPLADLPNAFLLNIDPLKNVDKAFPLHKFRIFKFWDEIKETAEVRLFRGNSAETNALYWEVITDITIELEERYSPVRDVKKGKVYLAQTDDSQSSDRDNLLRDMVEMVYEVFPDRLLSLDFKECTDQVNQHLKGCKLIIHMIPLVYARHFPDKQISLVEHQCMLSSSYANKQQDIKRIIWLPSDFEITDEENQIFVEKIQRDQDQSHNTMVLKVTLEELKKIYRKILAGEELDKTDTQLPDVYLIVDKDDDKAGEKLISSNSKKGMTISRNFKGITYNQHLKYLASSECVIINYTAENEPWFTMKVNDIFKSKGIDTSKPFKKLILVKEKEELNTKAFENRFSEVHVSSIDELKLDLAVKNN